MSRKKKRNKKKQQADLNLDPALAAVIECFSACGRCSYFWAGYRVIAGEKVIDTAVKENDPVWLNLPWSHPVRELLLKSYGVRFDVDYFHHEGSCKECQRQFTYHEDFDDGPDVTESVSESDNGETVIAEPEVNETVSESEHVEAAIVEPDAHEVVSETESDEGADSESEAKEAVPVVRARFKIERMPCVSKA